MEDEVAGPRDAHASSAADMPIREFSDFPEHFELRPRLPAKIRGWLLIVAAGLVLLLAHQLVAIATEILPRFRSEVWSLLTAPGTGAYHPRWAAFLIARLVGESLFALLTAVLLVLLFMRKRFFPRLMILFLIANFLFVAGEYLCAASIPSVDHLARLGALREMAGSFAAMTIWGPYFVVSERVKETFLN